MYGSKIEQPGLRVDGVYDINEQYRAVADLGIFFPDKTDFGGGVQSKVTWWEINANGNYILYTGSEQDFTAYGLGGLNFLTEKISLDAPGSDSYESTTYIGLNIGTGFEYALDFANLFGEVKFVLRKREQLTLGFGLRFPL